MLTKEFNYKVVPNGVCAAEGFLASGVHCGLRKNKNKPDLALIYSENLCQAAAVYTQNKVKGAPIYVTQKHLKNHQAQAIIVNSGNANTCNANGEEDAKMMCQTIAAQLDIEESDVVVASTGIIGQPLPIDLISTATPELKNQLSREGNDQAAAAILTTDTCQKEYALSIEIAGKTVRIGGISKGSGMIHPNMATMLCFVTTDVAIEADLLQEALRAVTDETFNMVSVDGDTSTNDMVTVLASGLAENTLITDSQSAEYQMFIQGLYVVLRELSRKIAQDGEGASKLLECQVTGSQDKATARLIAKSVITSSLVKSAMFGQDPNWGRILCAIGYSEGDFSIEKVQVDLASVKGRATVCLNGSHIPFDVAQLEDILTEDEIFIYVDLGQGQAKATAWGCDLTYDYVKINADYHT